MSSVPRKPKQSKRLTLTQAVCRNVVRFRKAAGRRRIQVRRTRQGFQAIEPVFRAAVTRPAPTPAAARDLYLQQVALVAAAAN
ncbi:MAG TPA: hypothetical protein VM238_13470 [Phycisphaerae bacterium]|nr:hypothetical protein [Phycisphaerae bacterium]